MVEYKEIASYFIVGIPLVLWMGAAIYVICITAELLLDEVNTQRDYNG